MRRTTKKKTPKPALRMRLKFHECLGRSVPTTQVGTVRLNGGPLVKPETLAKIEALQLAAPHRVPTGAVLDRLAAFASNNLSTGDFWS